jgi:hypothetical protein
LNNTIKGNIKTEKNNPKKTLDQRNLSSMDRSLLFFYGFKLFYFISFILLEEATVASVGEGPSITLIMISGELNVL